LSSTPEAAAALIMAGFNGRWALVSAENAEAYLTATHTPDELQAKMKNLMANLKTNPESLVEEVHVDKAAGTIQVKIFINGELKHEMTVEFNKEVDHTGLDQRPAKITATLKTDTKIVIIKKTATFEAEIVYTLSTNGTEVTTTRTSGGVTSTEKYKKL
jgi:hypothetical protein